MGGCEAATYTSTYPSPSDGHTTLAIRMFCSVFLALAIIGRLLASRVPSPLRQQECITYGQDITHLQSLQIHDPNENSSFVCQAGHWPLEHSCKSSRVAISLEIVNNEISLFHHDNLPIDIIRSWQMTTETHSTPKCSHLFQNIIFLPIPFDPKAYQSDGSNYYVIHVDLLLPLWNFLRTLFVSSTPSPNIFLFPFNSQSNRDLSTNSTVFIDTKKYWIQAIQILFEMSLLIPGDAHGITQFLLRSRREAERYEERLDDQIVRICFQNIQIGLPRYDRPSVNSLRRFSSHYREVTYSSSSTQSHLFLSHSHPSGHSSPISIVPSPESCHTLES
jgi:hypothetical protein